MKKIILFCLLINSFTAFAQNDNRNRIAVDPDLDMNIFIGTIDGDKLLNPEVFIDSDFFYKKYKPKKDIVDKLKSLNTDYSIKVYFGSWCGDSQFLVPAFLKISKEINLSVEAVEYIALNRRKKLDTEDISQFNIEYVPTFIFYRNGEEIGRIIEIPQSDSLEEDILQILTN